MNSLYIKINWPNGIKTLAKPGSDWLSAAKEAGIEIPTGCLTGSCGACEIDVDGITLRACINTIELNNNDILNVDFCSDPYW